VYDRKNAVDLESQWFYRWIRDTYAWHVVAQFGLLFALGGLPALVWGGALRIVWVYHVTWFVNSASHVWGSQTYNTGDLSRNNWWVGLLAFGEGEPGEEGRGWGGQGGEGDVGMDVQQTIQR
jgi:stearoyl-CoA desaturase (delta-9 desaturase)